MIEAADIIKARQEVERAILAALESLANTEDSIIAAQQLINNVAREVERLKEIVTKQSKDLRMDLKTVRNES